VPEIAKLGHVALVTPNLEESLSFWRDVVGLEEVERSASEVFLRAWGDLEHHTLSLTAGSEARVDHVGWRTKSRQDVAEFAALLGAAGANVTELKAGEERGQGDAIRVATPAGHRFELYYDVEKPAPPESRRSAMKSNSFRAWDHGVSPRRIDHVNLCTADPELVCDWLESMFGFRMTELIRLDDGSLAAGWMAVTNLMHDIAVMRDANGEPNRFHHIAYFLDNWHDIMRAADILQEFGVERDAGPGKHGISQAVYLYVKDPGSGHRLELFSGGYLIFDPDWEPVVWHQDELAAGQSWWGAELAGVAAMDPTTAFVD
jgi:catechol 2,3-dioxygenase